MQSFYIILPYSVLVKGTTNLIFISGDLLRIKLHKY